MAVCAFGQDWITVADDSQLNAVIKGFSGYNEPPTGRYLSVQIEKANAVNGIYRNVVRLWYGKGKDEYVNLLYNTFPTEDAARAALKSEYNNDGKVLLMDWDAVQGASQTFNLSDVNFKQEQYSRGASLRQSRASRKAASVRKQNRQEQIFELSFEGVNLYGSNRLEGLDAKTGLNASFYNREKRIINIQGTEGKAWAEIVKAPRRKGNALHFIAVKPNDKDVAGEKLRVTGSISGLNAVEVVNSVDIYVPRSWKALTKIEPGFTWLTVQEYWCATAGIPVEGEPQFRMTLGMLKKAGKGNKLYFDLKVQDLETTKQADGSWKEKYTTLYKLDDRESKRFEIPFGKWFNLRTEIVVGDSKSGHFRLVATDHKGRETVIFDEVCQTAASGYFKPGAKQPLYKSEAPLKLYTSAKMLQYMKGKPLEIYYDNWKYKAICISEE